MCWTRGVGIVAVLASMVVAQETRRGRPRTADEHYNHAMETVHEFDVQAQRYREVVLDAFDKLTDGAERSRVLSGADRVLILGDLREVTVHTPGRSEGAG